MILAGGFLALWALVMAAVVSPKLPVLHRLPLVGSPQLEGRLRLDGNPALLLRLGSARPRSALLEVGVSVATRADVDRAVINLLVPPGLRGERCNHRGRPYDEGTWMPRTHDRLGAHEWVDYWAAKDLSFTSDVSLRWFKLRFSEPGEYSIRLKVNSSQLYREYELERTVRVVEADELTQHDRAGELIDEGEELERRLACGPSVFDSESSLRRAVAGWMMGAKTDLPDLENPDTPEGAGESAIRHLEPLVENYLDALYDLRNRLGPTLGEPERSPN